MLCPTRIVCRRCNGKPQRRRGGPSVQLPDWFMVLHYFSRHYKRIRTYYVRLNIFGEQKKNIAEVSSRDDM